MAARVPYLNREDLPEADRVIFDNLAAEFSARSRTRPTCCAASAR
jgi:hypothetical protein